MNGKERSIRTKDLGDRRHVERRADDQEEVNFITIFS
jgi:hypothetical protein